MCLRPPRHPPFLNYQLGSQACLHVMGGEEPVSRPDFHTPRTFVSEKVHEKKRLRKMHESS